MKVCFPVVEAKGLNSEVYGHFGSAPLFIIVETGTNSVSTIQNKDLHHAHGACSPLKALDNEKIDAVVVGGIGFGALNKLQKSGIKVFQAKASTVNDNVSLIQSQKLPEFSPKNTCAGHVHLSGCKH